LPTGSTDAVVDVAKLAKVYRDVIALTDITLRVGRGEAFGFLGPNGAGKTTAIKLLLGLARPTAGSGTVLHRPIGDRSARAHIGYLPELFRYHDWMTAREELTFHADVIGISERDHRRAIDEVLDLVGLARRADHRIGTYSKGMQQRIGLAVALLGSPELVFLDEPTSALDPVGRHDVREILRALKERGVTVFLNSHLLGEVELVCDRVAIVNRGRIVADGPVSAVIGEARGVRMKISANGTPIEPIVAPFGTLKIDGDWHVVSGIDGDRVPALVSALVTAGVSIYVVEPLAATLEQRFLEALES
jgi:ABC-2 type transport system ATP-binding protein